MAVSNLIKELEQAVDTFVDGLSPIEKQIHGELLFLIKDLELNSIGKIENNLNNIRLLGKIRKKLSGIIFSDKYKQDVYQFTQAFDTVTKINNEYFATLVKDYTPKKVIEASLKVAVDATIEGLTETGMNSNVIEGIKGILKTNIKSGAEYSTFTTQLRDYILGKDEADGVLTRYARTYATDSINQYSAEQIKIVTDDLGLKWFRYVGSLRATSREFCVALVHKQWVHTDEIPKIIRGNIDGKTVSLSGLKENTTADNFQSLRGGWNCNHQLIPVLPTAVPTEIREAHDSKNEI